MADGALIGIDVGTTAVKAAVVGADGTMLARFAEGYPTSRSGPGRVEQDPEDWVRLVEAALERFDRHRVAAIGLCSQVNTHVFVDAGGRALAPAIQWQDGRAAPEAAELDACVTAEQKARWWGAPMPIDASHALARMLWMMRHRPEVWAATRWVMLPKDYCLLRLTGEATTDPISNIGLVDRDLRYIPEALALVGGASERVAPLVPAVEIAGRIGRGPHRGVPVVSGTMDAWAGLVGIGGAADGSAMYLSGTSEILGVSSRRVVPTAGAIVFPECGGVRVHAAPTQSGGDAKLWFCGLAGMTPERMAEMVAGTPRDHTTPLFLPQLEGERAPLWDASLRAAFLGVGRSTTLAHMARAIYEGVAFAARDAFETARASGGLADADVVLCGGGGFRSDPWTQIRADVLDVPLQRIAMGEPGVLGAAMFAAIAAGRFGTIAEASEGLSRHDRVFEPDPVAAGRYDELFAVYRDAVETNAAIGRRLAAAAR